MVRLSSKEIKDWLYRKIYVETDIKQSEKEDNVTIIEAYTSKNAGIDLRAFIGVVDLDEGIKLNNIDRFRYNYRKMWNDYCTANDMSIRTASTYANWYLNNSVKTGSTNMLSIVVELTCVLRDEVISEKDLISNAIAMSKSEFCRYIDKEFIAHYYS